MSLNPARPYLELEALMERLWDATEELAELAENAAIAEVVHKTRFAQELLLAEGTVSEKEAQAQIETDEEMMDRRIAEAKYAVQKSLLSTLESEIDAVRTINANARVVT